MKITKEQVTQFYSGKPVSLFLSQLRTIVENMAPHVLMAVSRIGVNRFRAVSVKKTESPETIKIALAAIDATGELAKEPTTKP